MIVISKKQIIENVPKKWERQYKGWPYDSSKFEIHKELLRNKPLTEEKIINIIGNKSWTNNICDECERDSNITILLGKGEDQEVYICKECLDKAVKLAMSFI